MAQGNRATGGNFVLQRPMEAGTPVVVAVGRNHSSHHGRVVAAVGRNHATTAPVSAGA